MPLKGNAEPTPCPSEQAYRRHLAHGEQPCEECRQAHRDHQAAERPAPTRFLRPECGTVAGYRWHRNHGEETCPRCRAAAAAYARSRHGLATGTKPGRTVAPCGTPAAYQRHRAHGEEPCEACLTAHRNAGRVYAETSRIVAAMAREVAS